MDSDIAYRTEVIKEVDQLPCSHPASVNVDVANMYYSFTKMVRPLLVVEIGCFIGFSTLHFAQTIREQGVGRIISIDAFDWDVDTGEGNRNRQEVAEFYRTKADYVWS
ncbi:MAG: class I SAM-dependent methyltransferase [Candidatus Thiodiazotropha sp. (ex Rostrolucina anterorostrata)]|nr:class I SAM-dependent methyltransferase [Candidatus Thiodiazotropha sp. (ex Rostrolucina anterorostrata)]